MPIMGSRVTPLADQYRLVKNATGSVKDRAAQIVALAQVSRAAVLAYLRVCTHCVTILDGITADAALTTAITNYARAQGEPAGTDLAADYAVFRPLLADPAVATGFIAWVRANMPKDANGNYVIYADDGAEGTVDIMLTVAQFNQLKTRLNTLIAAID